jgi:hypothetical protein
MAKNKFKLKKGLLVQKLDKQTVIFDSEKSCLLNLNDTASYIFNCLKRGEDIDNIAEKLSKSYTVEKTKAIKDVKEFINTLKKKKVIE